MTAAHVFAKGWETYDVCFAPQEAAPVVASDVADWEQIGSVVLLTAVIPSQWLIDQRN